MSEVRKKGYRLKGYLISNSKRSKSPLASEQHQLIFSSSNKNFRFSGIFKNEQKKNYGNSCGTESHSVKKKRKQNRKFF